MAYAKFDDGFADHSKHKGLSDGAFRLHVSGILHCARWLTDGHITGEDVPDLMRRNYRPKYLAELLERGLWIELMPGALYEIRDYLQWNDSRAKVMARRAKNAKRLSDWRARNGKDDSE